MNSDYAALTCNWLRSIKAQIGEEAARKSILMFVDTEETKSGMDSCGVSVREWILDKDVPELGAASGNLGADFKSAEFRRLVAMKPMKAKLAVKYAREHGFETVMYNDGDMFWLKVRI